MCHLNTKNITVAGVLLSYMNSTTWGVTIPDCTRIIMSESDKDEVLKLTNQSRNPPYLAQTWIEDMRGNKSRDLIVTAPPIVCLNPSEQIQIRMITQEKIAQLPKDRETLLYSNVRKILSKTGRKNVMRVIMQHALKLFWRLKATELGDDGAMTYKKVKVARRNGGSTRSNNKMPYHVTLGYIGTNRATVLPQTQSLMVTPFSYTNTQFKNVPSTFQVGYINDFGGLSFYKINCPVVSSIHNISVASRDQ